MSFRFALLLFVYALTLFVSATLLFLVQPMVGKMILPLLGGTPAVWNTCMVFFQAALLVGYAYAHATTAWLGERRQAVLHLALLLLPFLVLPIVIDKSWAPEGEGNPVGRVLLLLTATVGLPFFVVSTSAPLLQKWFARTDHPAARDPYFLYAASNVGSMLALLAYPTVLEPHLRLLDQSRLWQVGYAVLVGLSGLCAFLMWRSPSGRSRLPGGTGEEVPPGRRDLPDRLTWRQRLHWIALAFVPSSLMLGATTFITTDIAAIPLLWVLPLSLYLLSFILVFGRWPAWIHRVMLVLMPLLVLLLLFMMLSEIKPKFWTSWVQIMLHLGVLFVVAMVCHGELARHRPSTRHLTEFYLLLSLGGVLGGIFNALLAPLVFFGVAEYQLTLILACLLMPPSADTGNAVRSQVLDFLLPLAVGLIAVFLIWGLPRTEKTLLSWTGYNYQSLGKKFLLGDGHLLAILMYGLPAVLCYTLIERPLRFGLGVAMLVLAGFFCESLKSDVLYETRSFFGVLKVRTSSFPHETVGSRAALVASTTALLGSPPGQGPLLAAAVVYPGRMTTEIVYHRLFHGTTLHGQQTMNEEFRGQPTAYYHRDGPIGRVFAAFNGPQAMRQLAFIGLGTGTLASYGQPGMHLTYYEIDGKVKEIATNPAYFTYLQDCKARGVDLKFVMGDARLKIAEAEPRKYDLIVVDAFSSDAIPIHLITKEAVEMFCDKLADQGILAYHISNRYLNLEPVLGNLAQELSLAGRTMSDPQDLSPIVEKGGSNWVLLARRPEHFGKLAEEAIEAVSAGTVALTCSSLGQGPLLAAVTATPPRVLWHPLPTRKSVGVWTDDYSNVLRVFLWKN